MSAADRDDLILAFKAGATLTQLAEKYDISTRSVRRLVQTSSNRPQATHNRLTPEQRADVIRAYQTTEATKQHLADKFGVSLSTIKRILRQP